MSIVRLLKGVVTGRWRALRRWILETLMRARGRRIVHFLHIGKTGGTAITRSLSRNLAVGDAWVVLHEHSTTLSRVPERDLVTFVLRDPLDRFVSAFYSRKRQGAPAYSVPWSEQEMSAFRRFPDANSLAEALDDTVAESRHDAERAMRAIGHVRTHYQDWFVDDYSFRSRSGQVLLVGWLPHLGEYLNELVTRLGGDPQCYTLPDKDRRAHRGVHQGVDELSARARRNLRVWYEQDYQFIGLCRELDLFAPGAGPHVGEPS